MERKDKKEIYIIFFARNMWDITKLISKGKEANQTMKIKSYEQRKDDEYIIHE